jgi:hypothetical protein
MCRHAGGSGPPGLYHAGEWSGCGQRVQQSLGVRTHSCPSCGLVLDRDANAARNISWRVQRLRGFPAVARALNREPVGLEPTRRIRNVPVPWNERTPEWVINTMGRLIGMPLGFFTHSNSHLLVDMRAGRVTSIEGWHRATPTRNGRGRGCMPSCSDGVRMTGSEPICGVLGEPCRSRISFATADRWHRVLNVEPMGEIAGSTKGAEA